ncbi:MAG: nuclear transport factor 2 family protein [Micromonosporaceae bacterium]
MSSEIDVAAWIGAYARAWREKDADGVAGLFTADAVYRSHPLSEPHVGRDAIRAYWQRATKTQRELDLRFGVPVCQGDRAAVEWWAVMRDDEWRPGEASADGVTLPGCLMLSFTPDGQCAELREYYNPHFGERIPAPEGWGR